MEVVALMGGAGGGGGGRWWWWCGEACSTLPTMVMIDQSLMKAPPDLGDAGLTRDVRINWDGQVHRLWDQPMQAETIGLP